MTRRPRLLLIAYSFPPANRVGSVRAYNQAKYLTKMGWDVTVVTPHPSVWRSVDRAPEVHDELQERGIRFIHTDHRWRMLSHQSLATPNNTIRWAIGGVYRRLARMVGVEREVGWMAEAERATAGLAPDDVDVVFASGPPFISFRIAQRLSRRLGRPYVLEYRDLWTFNPHSGSYRQRTADRESDLLRGAAAIVAISPGLARSLHDRFHPVESVQVVTNGYDPEDLGRVVAHDFGHFAIVYAGVFYPPKRVIDPIMEVVARLKNEITLSGATWAFHYFGIHGDHVERAAERLDVSDRVVLHGSVPRSEALAAIKGAGVAVVVASVLAEGSVEDKGIVTGKVFDAIGLKAPLLAVAPPGSDLEGILATAGLGRRFSGKEVEEMAQFVAGAMGGRTPKLGEPTKYSWPVMVAQLDSILRRVRFSADPVVATRAMAR